MGVGLQGRKQDHAFLEGGFAYIKRMFPETQKNRRGLLKAKKNLLLKMSGAWGVTTQDLPS